MNRQQLRNVTERLSADSVGLKRAAALLRDGSVVAFPTETVYGLGGDATNPLSVAAIYAAKGRPSTNPLIVHVADLTMAECYAVFNDTARGLADAFWPGGLTLVLPLRPDTGLPPTVTAGNATVALRMPDLAIARDLIGAAGCPLAAPSANPSGRISATTADHVLHGLDGKIAAVLDGGPTALGLESTIVGIDGTELTLLREGAIPAQDLGLAAQNGSVTTDRPSAPGQLASHYAPKGSVRLNATAARSGETMIGFGAVTGDISLSETGDLAEAAQRLYAILHQMDARGATAIAVAPIPNTGLGRAINDRLTRAAAPRP